MSRPRSSLKSRERVLLSPTTPLRVNGLPIKDTGLPSFSTQIAEAAAEWLHRRVNTELGIAREQGRRYSWGYPACPDLEDHRIVFDILPAHKIGVSLTEAYQLVPEQSTAAIVLHHPQARYFAVYAGASAPDDDLVLAGAPET